MEIQKAVDEVDISWKEKKKDTRSDSVKYANAKLLQKIVEQDFTTRFKQWEKEKSSNALF